MPIKGLKFWRFDNTISKFLAYFHFAIRMRRNAYLRASGQKSDLAVRFGNPNFLYQGNNSSVGIHFRYVLTSSLVRMHRNSVNSASGLKTASPLCSATIISYKRTKIVAICQHCKRVMGIFSPRMRRNSYLGTSGQKSDPAIRSGDLDFL